MLGVAACIRSDDGLQVCRVHPVPVAALVFRSCVWYDIGGSVGRRTFVRFTYFRTGDGILPQSNICSVCRNYPSVTSEHLFGTSVRFVGSNEHLFGITIGLALSNICSDRPSTPTRSHRPSVGIGSGIGFPDRPSAADRFGSGSAAL